LIVRRAALALCVLTAACGGGGEKDDGVTQPPPATVAAVTVAPDTAFLAPGTTATLAATARDASGGVLSGKTVTWTSANLSVATVNAGVVTGVAAGTTTISASVDGKTGTATALVSTAQVNFTLDGVYATQAVQRFDGSVPLVVGGNAVLVNVFGTVSPLAPGTPRPRIRVRIMRGTQIVAEDTHDATGTIGLAVNRDAPIHQALFPSTVVQPGISVIAEVNPTGAIVETSRGDNVYPRSGTPLALTVRTVPELRVTFVPVLLSNGGTVGNVTTGNVPLYLTALRQMHPLGALTTSVAAPLSTDVAFGSGDQAAWVQILQAIDMRRVTEGSSSHYFGVLRPPPGVNFVTFGGWGYIPFDPNATGPGTRSAVAVQVGWFSDPRRATINVAHELAHNMGRRHAPCGGATGVDPAYPYANALTGAYGHDVFSITGIDPTTATFWNPATATDLMSYCIGWISDYTYEGIIAFRATGVVANAAPSPARDVLVVSGRIDGDGISLNPAFPAHAPPTPVAPGPYTLEALDGSGRIIASTSFASSTIDHAAPGTGDFAVALPIAPAERSAIVVLRVSSRFGGAELRRAALQPSLIAPLRDLRPARIAADRVELRWDAARWPGLMVRDPETGDVIGIGTSGRLVVATERRTLHVVLSDGIGGEDRTIEVP
jgi:Big-like domain-containing protein